MSVRASVKSPFDNLRPTILREPTRSTVSPEAEARLLDRPAQPPVPGPEPAALQALQAAADDPAPPAAATLLSRKKRERLLLVSFRMPQSLKEKLEHVAKSHEVNQTDLINEAIEINLQRYL